MNLPRRTLIISIVSLVAAVLVARAIYVDHNLQRQAQSLNPSKFHKTAQRSVPTRLLAGSYFETNLLDFRLVIRLMR